VPGFRALNEQVRQSGSGCLVDLLMGMFFAPQTLTDPQRAGDCAAWRSALGSFPPSISAVLAGIIDRADLYARARALTQPVVLIDGAEDQRFPESVRAANREAFQSVSAITIPDLGHMALIEDPVAMARALRQGGIGNG
jgi:pimeloyl-ACP methyl ester carboxylesterase